MTPPEPYDKNREAPDLPEGIRNVVFEAVVNAQQRTTARDLERDIANREGCPRSVVQSAIRDLIETGLLEYRYTFGQSYLAMSFFHPVDVSSRFTIVPPGFTGKIPSPRIPIVIAPGVSFGDGRHPTTRLALQALEMAWSRLQQGRSKDGTVAVDIGTGTGVLAIAAACLGVDTILALEIDACARSEAQKNIALNPLAAGIQVGDRPLETLDGPFDLVMANLRLPTLVSIADWMVAHLNPAGCAVVSGCREEEWERLSTVYTQKGLRVGGQAAMAGWSGGVFLPRDDPRVKKASVRFAG